MFNFKRLTATVVSVVMAISMVACGSDDKKKSGNTSVDTSKVKTIYDAVELADKYNCGKYESNVELNVKQGDKKGSIKLVVDGKRNLDDYTSNVSFNYVLGNAKFDMSLDNVCTLVDNKLYINLDSFVKAISTADTKFGSYGIVMPKIKKKDDLQKSGNALAIKLLKSTLADVEVTGDNGSYTATLKEGKDYYNFANGLVSFLDENSSDIDKLANKYASSVDAEAWIDDLEADITDDIVKAAEQMGQKISKSDVKEIFKQIKSQIPDSAEVDYETVIRDAVDEAKGALAQMSPEDFDKAFENGNIDCSINVDAQKKSFATTVKLVAESQGSTVELKVEYKINLEDVKVKKPSNATTISGIIKYVNDNPQVFSDIMTGAQSFMSKFEEFKRNLDDMRGDFEKDFYDDYYDDYDDEDDYYDDYDDEDEDEDFDWDDDDEDFDWDDEDFDWDDEDFDWDDEDFDWDDDDFDWDDDDDEDALLEDPDFDYNFDYDDVDEDF